MSLPAVVLIGRDFNCSSDMKLPNLVPKFWLTCYTDGSLNALGQIQTNLFKNTLVGLIGKASNNTITYIIGILAKPGSTPPEGFLGVEIPASRYAIGTIEGPEPDIYQNAQPLTLQQMKNPDEYDQPPLTFNEKLGFELEWHDARFQHNESIKIIDYYIPIK